MQPVAAQPVAPRPLRRPAEPQPVAAQGGSPRPDATQPVVEPPVGARGDAGTISDPFVAPTAVQPRVFSDNPIGLAEHALLGSLINSPSAVVDVAKFLHARDFSSSELRAVYAALRGLTEAGELVDVALYSRSAQPGAAWANQQRLFQALQANRFNPNHRASQTRDIVPNPAQVIGRLVEAAPPEAVPFRGVYDPMAQMRLARDVLAAAAKRRISTMARMSRATAPLQPARPGVRDIRGITSLVTNLGAASGEINRIADRWATAANRAGPDLATGQLATHLAAVAAADRKPPSHGIIAASRVRKAEMHLISVALHTGPNLNPDLDARLFTNPATANTWRMIQELRRRGVPVHYASLIGEKYGPGRVLQPVLSDTQIMAMATPPDMRPDRIANSLQTIVTAGLRYATKDTQAALSAAASNAAVPIEGLLGYATDRVAALAALADNAGAQHRHITGLQTQAGARRAQ